MKRLLTILAVLVLSLTQFSARRWSPREGRFAREAPASAPVTLGEQRSSTHPRGEVDRPNKIDVADQAASDLSAKLLTRWDWRSEQGGVVPPVKHQEDCGGCYAFAAIASIEARQAMNGAGAVDFSENNAKECNWREVSGVPGWGSCDGMDFQMLATLFSTRGLTSEATDPYVPEDVDCNTCVTYEETVLDWRMVSTNETPDAVSLKQYIRTYGPLPAKVFVDDSEGFDRAYDGSCTLDYTSSGVNHAVVIVGWSDQLPPICGSGSDAPAQGWIVQNSWGPEWGDNGYFYMAYGAGNLGRGASFIVESQPYNASDHVLHYDEDGWTTNWGYGNTGGWGLVRFTPPADSLATRVEFWTNDAPTRIDLYLYDDFDGTELTGRLASEQGYLYQEAGYHSVPLTAPVPITADDDVYVAVHFTNAAYGFPIPADRRGPHETNRTWISRDGDNWHDLGETQQADVAIRLRTTHPSGGAYKLRGAACETAQSNCALYDDGTNGDATGGDFIHTRRHVVGEPLEAQASYSFFRRDGEKSLPPGEPLTFDAEGPCDIYLLAQGNPYGIQLNECQAYASVSCDTEKGDFHPVSAIGGEDFAGETTRIVGEDEPLEVRVDVYAAGLTDAGDATAGSAVAVTLAYREWLPRLRQWSAWIAYPARFKFELDDGDTWQYVLPDLELPHGIYQLRARYRDWTGATGDTGANTHVVTVGSPLAPWR